MIRPTRSIRNAFGALLVAFIALPISAQNAQPSSANPSSAAAPDPSRKKALSIDDYSRWRTIEGTQISSDGKYAAYVLRQTNVPQADSRPVLHIVRVDDDNHVTIPHASQPAFLR